MEAAGDIIDFLPVDIICCILLWLPVSSLLRFKSVSKSWLSLVESSDFVNKHMYLSNACGAKQQQQDPLIILTCPYPFSSDNPQQMSLFSFDLLLHNKQQQRQEVEVELDFPVIDHYYQANPVQMVASWNGIICLRQHRTFCLWNPATKRCTNLPPLPVVSPQGSVGFGFDPNARDYKVVAINLACDGYVFHIYSLSSCSWRKCEGLDLHDMISLSGIKTPYRGSIYCWLAWNLNNQAVYMFDFSDEVFTSIPSPSSSIYVHDLFTITERIACVGKLRNEENTTYYEIWMLRDYRVEESWTKLYLVDLAPASETIQWMTQVSNNGDLLLFLTGKQLCLYDLVTQQVTNLPVHTSDGYEVIMYRESMLSVKRGNGAANGLTSKMDCNRRMLINQSIIGNSDWADSNVHRAVMFRILLWLPVLSLQRFKSACKLWCSLIKSSDFVTQHLVLHHHQHKQDNFSLILHSSYIFDHPFVEDSSHHSPNTSRTCLLSADKLELLDLPTFDSLYITTSFNGIICLARESNKYGDVCLWNPATKQFRNLCPERNFNDGAYFHFGFGFDIKTNSYKLVSFCSGNDSFVQVYCFSTNSWRIIYDEILPTIWSISSVLDAPYKDEIYCWLMDIDYSRAILSFDFSNEVFGTIPLPDSINKSSLTLKLTILKDKIVCISLGEKYYSDDTENWHCEVWMMNEYGVTESWFRLYMVGPFSKDWCFKMCYSKKAGDYILLLKDGQLYEYNLVTQDKERLSCQIQGPKDYQVVAYQASLLPIK